MAHLKNGYVGVMIEEHAPQFVSMRKSALTIYGGTLESLYDLHGSDDPKHRSRNAHHYTHKDFRINGQRDYRPWQRS